MLLYETESSKRTTFFFFSPLSSGSQSLCLCLSRPTAIHSNAPSLSACSKDEVQLVPVLTKGVLLHPSVLDASVHPSGAVSSTSETQQSERALSGLERSVFVKWCESWRNERRTRRKGNKQRVIEKKYDSHPN